MAHENNPRFIRHGFRSDKFMIANSCMHCSDPVCMVGCPTGAIHRNPSGQVIINDDTCIGCATCANSCPYNNIRMVMIRNKKGAIVLDEQNNPIVKATKCDLCEGQIVAPACEQSCPHDAMRRIDIHNITNLEEWLEA
jgi:Fe-S-cluster-containing dehydrogenase component